MATPNNYAIYLTNLEQVQTLQATYPTGIQVPPTAAAAAYGVPFPVVNDFTVTGGV